MIALSMNNLTKSFGITTILKDISFAINQGERVSLVGSNGSGKTTLFKIIMKEMDYDSGDIYYGKDLSIGYLSQSIDVEGENTLIEEVLTVFHHIMVLEKEIRELEHTISDAGNQGDSQKLESLMTRYAKKTQEFTDINGYAYHSEARGILIGLGFQESDLEKKVAMLSGGERTRLMLGKLLLKKPDILLLDEPTNHLDTDSIQWLETFLKQYTGTIFLISHDRYFLNQITEKTFELFHKSLKIFNGNYSYYVEQRAVQAVLEEKRYEENQAEVRRQQEVIAKLRSFGREKQVKRARSREKLLDKMEVLERPDYRKDQARITFAPNIQSGRDVLQVRDLTKAFGNRVLFENIDLDFYRGDKIALIGANGSGKSTFFNILLGQDHDYSGNINFGTNVFPIYFDQERDDLNPDSQVMDAIWDVYPNLTETQVRSMLGAFLFSGDEVFKQIKSLSGGEKARISLLKLMLSDSNFLFLDEPTNHLDIESREVLEDALLSYEGSVFVISHDRYFLNKIPDRILVLENQSMTEYLGNYDYYMEKKMLQEELLSLDNDPVNLTRTQQKAQKKKDKEKEQEDKKQKQQLKNIEEAIATTEEQIAELDLKLTLEEIYTDHLRAREISEQKDNLQNQLHDLMQQWETLLLDLEN